MQNTHSGTRIDKKAFKIKSIYAVTVTYGERRGVLKRVLRALLEQNISRLIVVNNGAQWDVKTLGKQLAGDRIDVVELPKNQGSAAGFAEGIKRACETGAEFIWLMDDDNEPQNHALATLVEAYSQLGDIYPPSYLAVLAYRPDHQPDVAVGVSPRRSNPRPASFWNFHLFDVPYKFWRRTPWGKPQPSPELPPQVVMKGAPYSGLLFHRAVIQVHGLPRYDFVLYGDDTEFTYRISRGGGTIRLITAARLVDLEASWNIKRRSSNSFQGWLQSSSDMRAFYGARNGTYIDYYCRPHNPAMFMINRRVYCLVLRLYASALRRTARYKLLRKAIHDGLAGRLGVHPEYPL